MTIISNSGLAAASIQAISVAAGVTKGALFHHFASKQALIDTLFADLLGGLKSELDNRMATDPVDHGRFTRAYVRSVFELGESSSDQWGQMWVAMLGDPDLRQVWTRWMTSQLDEHGATDAGATLEKVRLTADGIWLADLSGLRVRDRKQLQDELVAATMG